jgi:glycosyltransferase involved in cell wall biosynthesis
MNIVYISRVQMNPYVALLASAMQKVASRVTSVVAEDMSPRWLWQQRDEIDVLHFHWVELLYASSTWKGVGLKWLRFTSTILLAKLLGIKVAYTVHNISPHEGENAFLSRLTNQFVFKLADIIHVHDEMTRRAVEARFRRHRGVFVIPHGNYLSYPNTISKKAARNSLDIAPDQFVYLFLGQIRPYKGVEDLITAFRQLEAADARLVIAGNVHTPDYADRIQDLSEADSRIQLHLGYVPEEELQVYLNASDVCVLPYRHVTTSGAAILAFSFGKAVIAPSLGAFPQIVGTRRGILYEPKEPEALLQALRAVRYLDLESAGRSAYALAEEWDWIEIAQQHLEAYDSV